MSTVDQPSSHRQARSPLLAGLLSLIIPGLGQIYIGERYRGVSVFLCAVTSLVTVFWYHIPGWYLVPAIIWLWNIWDAVSLVRGKKRPVSIIIAAILVMGYGIGWQVTQIDLSALTKNLDRAYSIIVPMFHPDFVTHRA